MKLEAKSSDFFLGLPGLLTLQELVFWIINRNVAPENCLDAFPEKGIKKQKRAFHQLSILISDWLVSDPEPLDAFRTFCRNKDHALKILHFGDFC